MKTLLLSRADIESFFTMKQCMEAVENAFSGLAQGHATMPQRTPIPLPDKSGLVLFMPAHIKNLHALGTKIVSVYNENVRKHNLPAILGTILLLDEDTGFPIAIMDGGFITAMRTGASSGIATKYMARPDAGIGMIFGAGAQAFAQVLAIHEARPLTKLLVWSLDPDDKRREFAGKVTATIGVPVEQAPDPASAASQADIVVLATSATEPVVNGNWFRPGTHLNCIGAHTPRMRELDTLTVQRSRVICDLTDACRAEAGDFIIPASEGAWSWDKVAGNLGDVVLGRVAGRTSPAEITLFKSVGLAIQDVSAAKAVFEEAVKRGIGTEFLF
jgi:alanine dehydrogenase